MARPTRQGLDYFPLDVNFIQDIRMRKLVKYQGGRSITVYALLLCIIYKDGYYSRWDQELPFIISEQSGFEEAYIGEVIKCCLNIGLLSKEMYEQHGVLTSRGIQNRYQQICFQSRRKCVIDEFSLVVSSEETPISSEETMVSSEETRVSSVKTPVSSVKMPQRKVKKSKENNPPIIPPKAGGMTDAQSAEWGREFLKYFFEATPSDVLERRLYDLGITRDRFEDIALMVLEEWNDAGVRHQKPDGAVRHLFNHVRKKLRAEPTLRSTPTAAQRQAYRERRAAERQKAEEETRQYQQTVKATGQNGWQQYCAARGLDPEKTDARELAEKQIS